MPYIDSQRVPLVFFFYLREKVYSRYIYCTGFSPIRLAVDQFSLLWFTANFQSIYRLFRARVKILYVWFKLAHIYTCIQSENCICIQIQDTHRAIFKQCKRPLSPEPIARYISRNFRSAWKQQQQPRGWCRIYINNGSRATRAQLSPNYWRLESRGCRGKHHVPPRLLCFYIVYTANCQRECF